MNDEELARHNAQNALEKLEVLIAHGDGAYIHDAIKRGNALRYYLQGTPLNILAVKSVVKHSMKWMEEHAQLPCDGLYKIR